MSTVATLTMIDQEWHAALHAVPLKYALALAALERLGYSPIWCSKYGTIRLPGERWCYSALAEEEYHWNEKAQLWFFIPQNKNGTK